MVEDSTLTNVKQTPTPPDRQRHPAMVLSVLALVLVGLLAWGARLWVSQTREVLGEKVQALSVQQKADKELIIANGAKVEDAQVRLGILEARLKENAAQQQALEALYQNLLKNRDETVLTEVEQLIGLSVQQIQLLGNVDGALIALSQAETRLGTAERPGFTLLRQALRRDIDRLRALPKVDIVDWALKIDEMIRDLDQLPLMSEAPNQETVDAILQANKQASVESLSVNSDAKHIGDYASLAWFYIQRIMLSAWLDIRQLVSIREVSNPTALTLAPEQNYFIRENTRLRLLNARLSLLSRQQSMLRDDLSDIRRWIVAYYDVQNPRVKQTIRTLDRLIEVKLANDLPNLADSLSALKLSRLPSKP